MKLYKQPSVKSKTVPLAELYPIMKEVLDQGNTFCITVTGNSMYPFLKHLRDQAVFAPLNDRTIRPGDIVFYQRQSGQFVMHRVYAVTPSGVMTIVGDAQWTLEPGIHPDQIRAYVTKVIRKGKEINCEKGAWRSIMTMYMILRFRMPRLTRFVMRIWHYAVKLITDPACVIRRIKRMLSAK